MREVELLEDTRPFNVPDLCSYLNENCSLSISRLKSGYTIYRGRPNAGQVLFHTPYSTPRRSKSLDDNYYNLLLSHLSNWSDYPKREKSLIGATRELIAQKYGLVYVVFPLGNPEIAICPHDDIWDSFPYLTNKLKINDLEAFNSVLDIFLEDALGQRPNGLDKNYLKLQKAFKEIKKRWKENPQQLKKRFLTSLPETIMSNMYREVFLNHDGDLESMLMEWLDPTANGFKKIEWEFFDEKNAREVWFSAPSVLIEYKYFVQEIKEKLIKV